MSFSDFIIEHQGLVVSEEVDGYLEDMGFDFRINDNNTMLYEKVICLNKTILVSVFNGAIYIEDITTSERKRRVNVLREYKQMRMTSGIINDGVNNSFNGVCITKELLDSDMFLNVFKYCIDML